MFRHITRLFSTTSDRVKAVEFHPTEPMLAAALYNGTVVIFHTHDMSLLRTIRVDAQKPVRCVRWMPSRHCLITGGDTLAIQCFGYNTGVVASLPNAHTDFIRQIAVHPTQSQFLSCSDDFKVNLYTVEENGQIKPQRVFNGHEHFVMDVKFNPKDPSTFATASLDCTIKFWGLTSTSPRFTLKGHQGGVNCIEFFPGSDKPYLASGSDDFKIKLWDYQTKSCVATLSMHTANVTALKFHPVFPLLLSVAEDDMLVVWNSMTLANEATFNYQKKRGWCIDATSGNLVALGYDEGLVVLKIGKGSNVVVTMDSNGRTFWAKNNEIQSTNLVQASDCGEGQPVDMTVKDVSTSEMYVSSLQYNSSGRYVAVCGDNEYAIFSALAWRSKSFGEGKELAWGTGDTFAVRTGSDTVAIVNNFTNKSWLQTSFECERIFGGTLLSVVGDDSVTFYTWDDHTVVRQIDVRATGVWWSQSNTMVAIATDDTLFILSFNEDYANSGSYDPELGSEEAFSLISESEAQVKKGVWYNDVFFFNDDKTVSFWAGGRTEIVARIDKNLTLVGYVQRLEKVFFCDSDYNFYSFLVPMSVLEFVISATADDEINPETVPEDWRSRMCTMLEELGKLPEALELADNDDKRFELALKMGRLDVAVSIAKKNGNQQQWSQLSALAVRTGKMDILEEALQKAGDEAGVLLVKSCRGNRKEMEEYAAAGHESKNVSFAAYFATGNYDKCIDLLLETGRAPEAAMMARAYKPSRMDECAIKWQEMLAQNGENRVAQSIAVPKEYPNLFGMNGTEQAPEPEVEPEAEEKHEQQAENPGAQEDLDDDVGALINQLDDDDFDI